MFESNRELLGLCYDSVEEIRDGFYIVGEKGKYGIVDAGNNTIKEKKYAQIIKIGTKVFIGDKSGMFAHSIYDFKKLNEDLIYDIERFSEHAYLFSAESMMKGVMNDNGDIILPPIYRKIWVSAQNSMSDFIKARVDLTANVNTEQLSYTIMNKSYTKFDCYFAIATCVEGLQIVAVNLKWNKRKYGGINTRMQFKLRNQGVLVGKAYDDIQVRQSLVNFGLIQTYMYRDGITTTGLVKTDGTEYINADYYHDVTYIGNNITVVKHKQKYGTVVNGKEVVKSNELDSIYILDKIPITAALKDEKTYYIGNDGNIYDKVELAFPIYKSKICNDINLMCLYGTWIYVSNTLTRLHDIPDRLKDTSLWIKL